MTGEQGSQPRTDGRKYRVIRNVARVSILMHYARPLPLRIAMLTSSLSKNEE